MLVPVRILGAHITVGITSLSFNVLWDDSSSAAGDFILYLKNTDTTGKAMVLSTLGANAAENSSFKLHRVTGTAAAGASIVRLLF